QTTARPADHCSHRAGPRPLAADDQPDQLLRTAVDRLRAGGVQRLAIRPLDRGGPAAAAPAPPARKYAPAAAHAAPRAHLAALDVLGRSGPGPGPRGPQHRFETASGCPDCGDE